MTEYIPPCTNACPVNTDVRGYLAAIARRDYAEACRLISAHNPFPSVCAWVCPHPCEDNCRRAAVDSALSIRSLKRFAMETAGLPNHRETTTIKKTGKKVAIVGAGPGGLTAAHDLAGRGHTVVVYEKNNSPGGHFLTSLPVYRLPREALKRDIDRILAAGVEVRTGVVIGKDITIARLREQYDALIIGAGLSGSKSLSLPGFDHPGAIMALPFLRKANAGERQETGSDVLVIGGGDVAMDVARTAVRLGADRVKVICLELREQMPAHALEIEEALAEGVELINGYGPVEILNRDGQITDLKAQRAVSVFDREGGFSPAFLPGEYLTIPCDMVIQAVGQVSDNSFLNGSGLAVKPGGAILTDQDTMKTNLPGVFTCGEIVTGPGSAIAAVASGRRSAELVNCFLHGIQPSCPETSEVIGPLPEKVIKLIPVQGRRETPVIAPENRKSNFLPYELCFDEQTALHEAGRCLNCGLGARVDPQKCAACLTCLWVCPYQIPVVQGLAGMSLEECQACGVCAAFCPAGAVSVKNLGVDTVKEMLDAVSEKTGTVMFAGRDTYHDLIAGASPDKPPNLKTVTAIVLPTAGALRLQWILSAFENGAAKVIVMQDKTGGRHPAGGERLIGLIERARRLLEAAGMPGANLSYGTLEEWYNNQAN